MFCPPKYTLVIGDILIKKSFFSNKSVNFLRGVVAPSIGCKSNKQPRATARRGRVEWKQGGKGGKSKHPRAKPLKGMPFSQIPLFKPRQYHFQTFQYQKIRQILNSYIILNFGVPFTHYFFHSFIFWVYLLTKSHFCNFMKRRIVIFCIILIFLI